jgi:cysteine desulfurase/selenocysteine lyase
METIENVRKPRSRASELAIQGFRALFPALQRLTYLNVADRGILATPTREALIGFADHMMYADTTRVGHEVALNGAKGRFAKLMGAEADEVAFVHNVSDGVNSIIGAFDWKDGDNVVMCPEVEHPNNLYPWLRLARRGVTLKNVKAVNGVIDPATVIAAIDKNTRMVTAASVTFAPGSRTDLAAIGKATTERGVFFLVDGVQSCGVLVHDARREMFDAFCTSTSKGLLGIYGSGFLYCRKSWWDKLVPTYLSRTGVNLPPNQHSSVGDPDYQLATGAGRFEVGSHAFAGAYAAECSLGLLADLGADTVEIQARAMARAFTERLVERGMPVSFGANSPHLAHIVTLGKFGFGGHDVSQDERINQLSSFLKGQDVIQTIRAGQLRFAFHAYNNIEDVERAVAVIDDCTRRHALKWGK